MGKIMQFSALTGLDQRCRRRPPYSIPTTKKFPTQYDRLFQQQLGYLLKSQLLWISGVALPDNRTSSSSDVDLEEEAALSLEGRRATFPPGKMVRDGVIGIESFPPGKRRRSCVAETSHGGKSEPERDVNLSAGVGFRENDARQVIRSVEYSSSFDLGITHEETRVTGLSYNEDRMIVARVIETAGPVQ